jgi:mevalonate kinase
MFTGTAPGKVILFGEHAVVYGRPAVAAPLMHLRARATIEATGEPDVMLVVPDLQRQGLLSTAKPDNPLAAVIRMVEEHVARPLADGYRLTVASEIPIAGGLGSGAAISVAVIRALASYLEIDGTLSNQEISGLAYEVERLHHGTPSGIDNTVIAFEQPVYFVRRRLEDVIQTFALPQPLRLVIVDTGVRSKTKDVVNDVRRRWEAERERFEALFDACGRTAEAGYAALACGDLATVGSLMNENHARLAEMTVSSPTLDRLSAAARAAGALGAKLSGAGRGGNVIALVTPATETEVRNALYEAGAVKVYASDVGGQN